MSTVQLKCRHYRLDYGPAESAANTYQREKMVELVTEETAFVLVDTWELRGMDQYAVLPKVPRKDTRELVEPVVQNAIRPALAAARRAGLLTIYMPSDYVVEKYPEHRQGIGGDGAAEVSCERDWPPAAYTRQRCAEYLKDRYGIASEETQALDKERMAHTYIHSALRPRDGDLVLRDAEELHGALRQHRIVNLIYVGFALNMCMLWKPGAIFDMSTEYGRGYFTILLRDCTVAAENDQSLAELRQTQTFVEWIEMVMGYTSTSGEFAAALSDFEKDELHGGEV